MKARKILSILVVMIMALSVSFALSGCGDDPLDTFKKASENMEKAKDSSFDGSATLNMTVPDMTGGDKKQKIDITADFDASVIKGEDDDPLNYQMAATLDVDLSKLFGALMGDSGKTTLKMWMKDKTMYMEVDGEKTKSKLDDKTMEQIRKIVEDSGAMKIDDYVKDSEQDGDKLKFTLDTKKMMDDAMKKTDELGGDTAKQYKEMMKNAELKDTTLEATVKDEKFTSLKYTIPMSMDMGAMYGATASAGGDSSKMEMEIVLDIKNIQVDTGKSIEFPNFKDFKEDAGALTPAL